MPLTVSINLNVTPLPDNEVWWVNSAAWTNYWKNIDIEATFDPITTTVYVPTPYNDALQPVGINYEGNDYILVTQTMFESLKTELQTLNAAVQLMRTQMKAAGLISEAQ